MEAAERTARQKEQAEKDKIERMNADLKEVWLRDLIFLVILFLMLMDCEWLWYYNM